MGNGPPSARRVTHGRSRHPRVVRGRIKGHAWVDEEVLFQTEAGGDTRTRHHYASRIVFDSGGVIYIVTNSPDSVWSATSKGDAQR